MKRLGRWLFNLAAGGSALVFVLMLVFWFRSYGKLDEWFMSDAGGRRWEAVSYRGSIHIFRAGKLDQPWRRLRWDTQSLGSNPQWADLYTRGTLHWKAMGLVRIGIAPARGPGAAAPFSTTAPAGGSGRGRATGSSTAPRRVAA